jgi:hypothetical protein
MSTRNEKKGTTSVKKLSSVQKKISKPPVSVGKVVSYSKPKYVSRGSSIEVTHREFYADLTGHVNFTVERFDAINPGNVIVFPWLSDLAGMYESYRFKSLNFIYEPVVGTFTNGSVMMAIDYDATDGVPASKVRLMSYDMATRGNCWESLRLTSKLADLQKIKEKFVSDHAVAPNEDVRLFNVGNLSVATFGVTNGTLIGELYVEYVIELDTPQLEPVADFLEVDWVANTAPNGMFNWANITQVPLASSRAGVFSVGTGAGLANNRTLQCRKLGNYCFSANFTDSLTAAVQVTPPSMIVTRGAATIDGPGSGGIQMAVNGGQGIWSGMLRITAVPFEAEFDATPTIVNNISSSFSALRIYRTEGN